MTRTICAGGSLRLKGILVLFCHQFATVLSDDNYAENNTFLRQLSMILSLLLIAGLQQDAP